MPVRNLLTVRSDPGPWSLRRPQRPTAPASQAGDSCRATGGLVPTLVQPSRPLQSAEQ